MPQIFIQDSKFWNFYRNLVAYLKLAIGLSEREFVVEWYYILKKDRLQIVSRLHQKAPTSVGAHLLSK